MKGKKQNKRKQQILNSIPIFLSKTYRIVDNPEHEAVIGWTEDEKSFVVKDITKLTTEIFPCHFKHSNFTSFVRQLNMYGFHKVRSDIDGQVFNHECFQKNEPQKLSQIKRRNSQQNEQEENMATNNNMIMPISSRQQKLEMELQLLKSQHEQLQNMMQILMDQNRAITSQNKTFTTMMTQMKEKYRKKLQTLMLLFIFGKKAQSENGEQFIIQPQFQNMLEAFQQLKSGNIPFAIEVTNGLRKRNSKKPKLKMITSDNQSDFGQNGEISNSINMEQKEDIFKVLKDDDQQKPTSQIDFQQRQNKKVEMPASPLSSALSRPYRRNYKTNIEWDEYLEGLNQSDDSQAAIFKQENQNQL